jgi:hypothetical protein
MFVTSQGTAHGRFTRAIRERHLPNAELAARELGGLSLDDALALTLLIAEDDRARFERAALRWHARFELETKSLTLAESQLVLAALAAVPGGSEQVARAIGVLRYRPT